MQIKLTDESGIIIAEGNVSTAEIKQIKSIINKSIAADEGLFSAFWAAYPKKVAKPKAISAFAKAKITADILQEILADINRRKCGKEWNDSTYIPYPATYLNNRRWEDEQTVNPDSGNSSFDTNKIEMQILNEYQGI